MAGQDFVVAVGQMVAKATQWTQRSWNARSISDSVRPEKEQSADPKIFKRAPTGGNVALLAKSRLQSHRLSQAGYNSENVKVPCSTGALDSLGIR